MKVRGRYAYRYRQRADQVFSEVLRFCAKPLWYVCGLSGGLAEIIESFADRWAGRS